MVFADSYLSLVHPSRNPLLPCGFHSESLDFPSFQVVGRSALGSERGQRSIDGTDTEQYVLQGSVVEDDWDGLAMDEMPQSEVMWGNRAV